MTSDVTGVLAPDEMSTSWMIERSMVSILEEDIVLVQEMCLGVLYSVHFDAIDAEVSLCSPFRVHRHYNNRLMAGPHKRLRLTIRKELMTMNVHERMI